MKTFFLDLVSLQPFFQLFFQLVDLVGAPVHDFCVLVHSFDRNELVHPLVHLFFEELFDIQLEPSALLVLHKPNLMVRILFCLVDSFGPANQFLLLCLYLDGQTKLIAPIFELNHTWIVCSSGGLQQLPFALQVVVSGL